MSDNLCALCKAPALQNCSACKEIFYCGKEHQKQDWKNHKNNCAPYKIENSDTLGRYLIASRDIKAGDIIMKENPIILAPNMASFPLCLGCHKKLDDNYHSCSKCEWPLCGKQCELSVWHQDECQIFEENGCKPDFVTTNTKQAVYSSIAPLRALLLKRDAKKFEILRTFRSHLDEQQNSRLYEILRRNLVPLFVDKLRLNTCDQEIMELCSIFSVNSFEVRDDKRSVTIRGVYPLVSLLQHSCMHNTKYCFKGDNFQLVLAATVPIKKGEPITTSYTQTLWGTLTRRAHLKQSKFFDCSCSRCQDPTEFGTYAGSIYCANCKSGTTAAAAVNQWPKMISANPLDQAAPWKCERCSHVIPAKQIIWGNDALRREVTSLDRSHPDFLETFLEKYRDTLHPTNWHCLEMKYALTQVYGNISGFSVEEIPIPLLDRKIDLCRELLDVAAKLEPGLSRLRGCLLYELQAATVARTEKEFCAQNITKEEAETRLAEAIDLLGEAAKILSFEPNFKEILQKKMGNSSKILGQ